mgnify:FL=1
MNGKFGVTWRLHQALVKPKASISGKCFISLTPTEASQLAVQRDDVEDEETDAVEVVESEDENVTEEVNPDAKEEMPSGAEASSVAEEETDGKKQKKRVVRRKE